MTDLTLDEMIDEMVNSDYQEAQKERHLIDAGFEVANTNEQPATGSCNGPWLPRNGGVGDDPIPICGRWCS